MMYAVMLMIGSFLLSLHMFFAQCCILYSSMWRTMTTWASYLILRNLAKNGYGTGIAEPLVPWSPSKSASFSTTVNLSPVSCASGGMRRKIPICRCNHWGRTLFRPSWPFPDPSSSFPILNPFSALLSLPFRRLTSAAWKWGSQNTVAKWSYIWCYSVQIHIIRKLWCKATSSWFSLISSLII